MAKTTIQVQPVNRNIVLKSETQAELRAIARLVLALKSEKLVKLLEQGIVANDKVITIKIEQAENASQSGVEVL